MLTVEKKTLATVLDVLEGVVESKATIPLHTYVRLSVSENEVRLSGMNGENYVEAAFSQADASSEWAGRVLLIPGATLFRLVRVLPGDTVTLTLEEKELGLRSGSFDTRLTIAEPEEWDQLEVATADPVLALPSQTFWRALSSTEYAISREEYRAIFRGAQLEFSEKALRVVASDGYRLALMDLEDSLTPLLEAPSEGEEKKPFQAKLVVPGRSIPLIGRLLKLAGEEDRVELAPTKNSLDLHLAPKDKPYRFRASFQLMEGEFPEYQRVIPKEIVLDTELDSPKFQEALRRLLVIADRQNHRIDLTFEEGKITLAAWGDYGRGQEEVQVRTNPVAAELPFTVSFNGRYLLDALEPIPGAARLALSGTQTPALIEDLSGSGYRAVVVPLRV